MKNCPNCNQKLGGLLSSTFLIPQKEVDFINTFRDPKSESYCNDCSRLIIKEHRVRLNKTKQEIISYIDNNIDQIPIITINNPTGWNYSVIDMISAQSVSGTGFLSEISSSWSDFTGSQSGSIAEKINSGEEICKKKLRYSCLNLGGNAIISTDIDYSEVGGGKGMLMVCMSGTAVDVEMDTSGFKNKKDVLESLILKSQQLMGINKIANDV